MRRETRLGGAFAAVLLALAALLQAPVLAAEPGFHAAYFSESAFLGLQAGQTGQFSVGFTNTGDRAWEKGVANSGASLHTAAPLDNTTDHAAGWGPTWVAPNIYSRQINDLVAPGQIGFFLYDVKVPAGTPNGPHTFYGRPVIDGVGPLEDYGYYQIATVVASTYTLSITSSSPSSPSISATPNILGTGAPPLTLVTISEGSTAVGSATSSSDGSFTVSITTALTSGAHSLVASAAGATSSTAFTYTVGTSTTTPTTTTPTTTTSGTITMSRPGLHSIILTFSKAVNAGPIVASNFKINSANFPSTPRLQTGNLSVALDFPSTSLLGIGTHVLDVYGITYQDGTTGSPNPTSFTYTTTADTTTPAMSSISAVGTATIEVTYSEPMQSQAYFPATNSVDVGARYQINDQNGAASGITVTAATMGLTYTDNALFNNTKVRLTLSSAPSTSQTYTLIVQSVADPAGNVLTSGSTTFSMASVQAPTISSISATQLSLTVTYSKAMAHAATAGATSATTCAGTGTQIDNKSNYTMQSPMSTALANAATTCLISSDERTVTFTFPNSTGYAQGSYTYSIANVSDVITTANTINPNPSTGSVSATQSVPKLASVAYMSSNAFTVTFSETMSNPDATSTTSARTPDNYAVTANSGSGTANGTYGSYCSSGTPTVSTSDSKTFTVQCPGSARWSTESGNSNTVSVRRAVDSDASQTFTNSSEALTFTVP